MRRTKQATSMFEPLIYKLMEDTVGNVSLYLHDLAVSDLIKRGVLTGQILREMHEQEDHIPDVQLLQDSVS